MHDNDNMRDLIEEEMKTHVQRLEKHPSMGELIEMMSYHLGWTGVGAGQNAQGKRIRPILLALCAAASGGNWRISLPAASAVELIHNFSLIHDDIEDKSEFRRGRPTLWVKWGTAQAINTGDAMFSMAHLAMFDLLSHLPANVVLYCVKLLQETCLQLTLGQHLDISFEVAESITLDTYWQMIQGKTAALLACCCELGARIGGSSEKSAFHYQQFGRNLGLAFQALDDILGIWGDSDQTGKSAQSDLQTGKKTLPVLYGYQLKGKFYKRWHNRNIEPTEISEATAILLEEGAKDYTQEKARQFTDIALDSLEKSNPKASWADELRSLTNMLLSRKS